MPGLTDETVVSMDIFPALVELTKQDNVEEYEFDGLSFMSVFSDDYSNLGLSERPIMWRFQDKKSVRLGDWKLLIVKDKQFLFNLKDDLSEQNNLIEQYQDKKESLLSLLEAWEMEMEKYELRSN